MDEQIFKHSLISNDELFSIAMDHHDPDIPGAKLKLYTLLKFVRNEAFTYGKVGIPDND
jgi:hypothetical protein